MNVSLFLATIVTNRYNARNHLAAESVFHERLRASIVIGGGSGEWLC